jgi:hypothetical protein
MSKRGGSNRRNVKPDEKLLGISYDDWVFNIGIGTPS